METPAEAFIRHILQKESTATPSTTPKSTICSSLSKHVFLHDWWLIKADSDAHGKRLGIGGFASKERQGIRSFSSAPIVNRHDAVTLKTVDGIMVLVHGYLNRSRTLENGFSHEECEHFLIGFPYYWEEFASLSVDEEPAHFSRSHTSKTSTPGDHATDVPRGNILDDILQNNYDDSFHSSGTSSATKENSPPIKKECCETQRRAVKKTCVAYEKAMAFASRPTFQKPHFISVMQPSYVSNKFSLNVPSYFSRQNLPVNHGNITIILVRNEKKWSTTCYVNNRRAKLLAGWNHFVEDNGLKVGDACIFEVAKPKSNNKNVWNVLIFKS